MTTDFRPRAAVADAALVPAIDVSAVAELSAAVRERVATVVVGFERPLTLTLAGVLARGHVLVEDVPGLGKTLATRTLAAVLGLGFRRLQCTPDLLPADVTGSYVYSPTTGGFDFRPGPIFTGILLADEINRATPRTQSALLEAMQESQVTVEGTTFALPRPFHLFATSNPVEYEGTFPLPEAQLDRFLVRVDVGYPGRRTEADIVRLGLRPGGMPPTPEPLADPQTLLAAQAGVDRVSVDDDVVDYCVDIATATRAHAAVEVGASPRATLALTLVARSMAAMAGRSYVLPEDVKEVAPAVLAHRLTLTADAWARQVRPTAVIDEVLAGVPAPAAARRAGRGERIR
jgi:MoxR-like ATPase